MQLQPKLIEICNSKIPNVSSYQFNSETDSLEVNLQDYSFAHIYFIDEELETACIDYYENSRDYLDYLEPAKFETLSMATNSN